MDHLRCVKDGEALFGVPLVRITGSDLSTIVAADAFLSFPLHHLKSLREHHPETSKDEALLSVVQSWLFFGTLIEFFRGKVVRSHFRKTLDDGRKVICTRKLRRLLREWPDAYWAGDDADDARRLAVRTSGELLARSLFACERFGEVPSTDDRLHRVLFSVKVLICTLAIQARSFSPGSDPLLDAVLTRSRFRHAPELGTPNATFLLWDTMVESRWCPHQIRHMLQTQPVTSMCHLATLKRPEHHGNHRSCDEHPSCVAHEINWKTFKPSHDHGSIADGNGSLGTCPDVPSDEEVGKLERNMMDLLRQDKIPLISCSDLPNGRLHLEVIPAGRGVEYTAISHVWADGLGNAASNQLPECRVKAVVNAVREVEQKEFDSHRLKKLLHRNPNSRKPKRTIFWMDIFCVPKGGKSNEHEELEKTAISAMTATYVGAKHVLVLDSELQGFLVEDTTHDVFGFHLMSCRWMGRCWTLQEGALASPATLWYKFMDGVAAHESVYSSGSPAAAVDCSGPVSWRDWWQPTRQPFVGSFKVLLSDTLSLNEIRFLAVWNSFLGRSTTKPKDVHIVLANLLGFSAIEISGLSAKLEADDDEATADRKSSFEKMKTLLLAQSRLPVALFTVFQQEVSHKPRHLSWIPEAPIGPRIVGRDARMMSLLDGTVKLDPKQGPYGFFTRIPNELQGRGFCLDVADANDRPHIKIKIDHPTDSICADVYLYLNLQTEAHPLIQDTYGTGACFSVMERRDQTVKLRFESTLHFSFSWARHDLDGTENSLLPVEREESHHQVSVSLEPCSFDRPSLERPADLLGFFGSKGGPVAWGSTVTYAVLFGIAIVLLVKWGLETLWIAVIAFIMTPLVVLNWLMYITTWGWLQSYATGHVPWYVAIIWSSWVPNLYNMEHYGVLLLRPIYSKVKQLPRLWRKLFRLRPRRWKPGRSAKGKDLEMKETREAARNEGDAGSERAIITEEYDAFEDMRATAQEMLDERYAKVLYEMDWQMWWAESWAE